MFETIIQYNDYTDREGRNIKLYVAKNGNSFGLPLLSEKELRNVAEKILEFLG